MLATSLKENAAQANALFDAAYTLAQENNKGTPKTAVLGIDLGGTKLDWAVYPVEDGKIGTTPILSGKEITEKGLDNLAQSYSALLHKTYTDAAKQGYIIGGIGAGSPGRFVHAVQYAKTYGKPPAKHTLAARIGNPYQQQNGDPKLSWQPSALDTIANNTAENLGSTKTEFDGVVLESFFQRLTPAGVQAKVSNDATVQMQGLAKMLLDDPDHAAMVDGREVMYVGPGTGLGMGRRNKLGEAITDGHPQFLKLFDRTRSIHSRNLSEDEQYDKKIFNIIAKKCEKDYQKEYGIREIPLTAIAPEHMLSGTGIWTIIADAVNRPGLKGPDFDTMYAEEKTSPNMQEAIKRLHSLGRYYGDYLVGLHKGQFSHLDRKAEWSGADKLAISNYETIVFGGGTSQGQCFKDIVIPEIQAAFTRNNIKANLIIPKRASAVVTHASASTLSDGTLKMTADILQQHHARIEQERVNSPAA